MPSNDPVIYVPNGLNWLYNFLLVCICIQSSKSSVSKMNLSKNKKSIIRIVLKIILYVSLLFLFSYFYMKDQMLAFLNRRTTKTNREEKARVLEFPTTTICFNPGTKLSVSKRYFEHGVEDSKDCVKRLYSAGNCSRHCGLLSLTDLPICPSTEQLNCVWGQAMLDGGDNFTNCLMTKHATTYDLITKVIEPYHHDPNLSTTEIIIGLWTMQILKEERVPVLTFEDLIGSVGGSLGMFFGFSISSIIVSCINKIL